MAAFKRGDRPSEGYKVWPTLPGFGRVGPWQTGFQNKAQADRVEAWLAEVALTRPEVIEALQQRRFSLRDAWVAKVRSTKERDRLGDLLRDASDPLLAAASAAFARITADARVRDGVLQLSALADAVEVARAEVAETEGARRAAPKAGTLRLSWLLAPANVTELYVQAQAEGWSAGSVYRAVHRAVADLVAHHFGRVRSRMLMVDVTIPKVEDERKVRVTGEELHRVLADLEPDMVDLAALAMLLAVDREPLLRIVPRHFAEERGLLEVQDTKNAKRTRTIELSTPALAILRRRVQGREIDEPVFDFTPSQVRHRWEEARDRAAGRPSRNTRVRRGRDGHLPAAPDPVGEAAERILAEQGVVTLPLLRFKDLRHLLPTAWNALGLPHADLQGIMGHARGSKQTDRYITARIQGDRENLDRVAAFLGLDRLHLRASGE